MYINSILYGIIAFLVKFSILYQYRKLLFTSCLPLLEHLLTLLFSVIGKIFAPIRQVNALMFYGAWTLIVITFLYYTIGTSFTIWGCSPRAKYWNPFIEGHCVNQHAVVKAAASFNISSDVLILLLPSWSIWQLHVSLRKKLQIFAMMAMGLLYVPPAR